jgi:hypothetical protein
VVACSTRWGAVSEEKGTQGKVSGCNFTDLAGDASRYANCGAAALNQGGNNLSSTDAIYLLFVGCGNARGCWYCDQPPTGAPINVATFERCSFVDNSIAAIAIENQAQVRARMCYFKGTTVVHNWGYGSGWVTVEACLFAADVPLPMGNATLTGVQITSTSTEISFNTASMILTCGGIAEQTDGFEETKLVWGRYRRRDRGDR